MMSDDIKLKQKDHQNERKKAHELRLAKNKKTIDQIEFEKELLKIYLGEDE